jgi:ABC-type uncharacterized transport system substrate-binding protein
LKRREFLTLLGAAAAAWPPAARAQKPTMQVIGFLHSGLPEPNVKRVAGLRKGLAESGFVEGKNIAIDFRWAEGQDGRLPELAADLVRQRVAVIATLSSTAAAVAAKAATSSIPIYFLIADPPVELGLVNSLNRPGGNATGISDFGVGLGAKRLGLLHELLPGAARFGVLVNPDNPLVTESFVTELQTAALAIGRQIEVVTASTNGDIDTAFATLVKKRADALLVSPDPLFVTRRVQLITLAVRYVLPALYHRRELAEAGGLMSYGSDLPDQWRQAGVYVGRILKGEKPAEMPVQLPTRFDFVINLQTAKTLAIEIPATLLARADEVIE